MPECRSWLERMDPVEKAANQIQVLPDSPAGEIQEAFGGMVRNIRFRVYCSKGWGHSGQHKFQVGYEIRKRRKKIEL